LEAATVRFTFASEGQTVEATFQVIEQYNGEPRELGTFYAGRDGIARLWLPPDREYVARVEHEGFFPKKVGFITAALGEDTSVHVELEQRGAPGVLVVTPVNAPTISPGIAGFGFYPTQSEDTDPVFVRDVQLTNGHFKLEDLPAGDYRVVIQPGDRWGGADSYWCQSITFVTIPPGGRVSRHLENLACGRMSLDVVDNAGNGLEALCRIRNDQGESVKVRYIAQGPDQATTIYGDRVGPNGTADVIPNLPSGTYYVEFSLHSYESTIVEAHLIPWRTTKVLATLAKTP
jgi:hypothetical protein